MGYSKFEAIVGRIDPERRSRIDDIKARAHADGAALSLGDLCECSDPRLNPEKPSPECLCKPVRP